jgi:hypothetical protein
MCKVVTEFAVDAASVVLVDEASGQRFRLPKGDATRDAAGPVRAIREVVSERSLANIHGTFYEIPRSEYSKEELDFRRLKPVASHDKHITDFCTWRGLLVLAGCRAEALTDGHYFSAGLGQPGLWFGMIDDLWQLGKPAGVGGPWHETQVSPNEPSDPYLMTNYDQKTLKLRHDSAEPVTFRVEVDFTIRDQWKEYRLIEVPPGEETPSTPQREERLQRHRRGGHRQVGPAESRRWLLPVQLGHAQDLRQLVQDHALEPRRRHLPHRGLRVPQVAELLLCQEGRSARPGLLVDSWIEPALPGLAAENPGAPC